MDRPVTDLPEPDERARPAPPDAATDPPRRRPLLATAVTLVAVLAGSALFMSGYTLGHQTASEPGTAASDDAAFQPFWDTYHTIEDRYAGGAVDRETLVQGAIKGMIGSLDDPFSQYLTTTEYRDSLQGISGQFEGIGAEIATSDPDGGAGCTPVGAACRLVVTKPIAGSPAARAGLRPGDVVLTVDGASLDGLTVDDARGRIRGPRGTVVTLAVQRGKGSPMSIVITRDIVQNQEVDSEVLAGGTVGYLAVHGFSDSAADQAVAALREHHVADRTKLILDLRGNPGGYVTAARTVASQFIGSGVLFWEQDASGTQLPTDAVAGGVAIDPAVRLVVLIDHGTASASEIVAGALQDSGRAVVVGQQSYGKGTVQQWQELTGEGGAFKLTVARWLTPNKRWIHQVGLTPDVVVTAPDPLPAGSDPTLDRALEILAGAAVAPVHRAAA